jgi:hypothetical protein
LLETRTSADSFAGARTGDLGVVPNRSLLLAEDSDQQQDDENQNNRAYTDIHDVHLSRLTVHVPRGAQQKRAQRVHLPARSGNNARVRRAWCAVAVTLFSVVLALSNSSPAPAASTVWLCRPGLTNNPCDVSLATTRFNAQGQQTGAVQTPRSNDAPVDCFYVYPTVSDEPGPVADFAITPELRSIALYQAARYSSECRVFAPVYRQITILGLGGGATAQDRENAYQDVRSAWLEYLAHDNHGRGVVFIGHSQGSGVLRRLLREEVDPKPDVRAKLVSAILLGGGVTVARGSDRGGDFQNIPACRQPNQVGCVIAFSTFDQPVPAASRFGRTTDPSLEVLCTNPAQLRSGNGKLTPINPTEPFAPGTVIALVISFLGQPTVDASTPWVQFDDAYRAQCVNSNGANVLMVTPFGVAPLLNPSPDATWGLHLVDANIALGDLVDIVHHQAIQWTNHHH